MLLSQAEQQAYVFFVGLARYKEKKYIYIYI